LHEGLRDGVNNLPILLNHLRHLHFFFRLLFLFFFFMMQLTILFFFSLLLIILFFWKLGLSTTHFGLNRLLFLLLGLLLFLFLLGLVRTVVNGVNGIRFGDGFFIHVFVYRCVVVVVLLLLI